MGEAQAGRHGLEYQAIWGVCLWAWDGDMMDMAQRGEVLQMRRS